MSVRKYLVIAICIGLLSISIGYATFSSSLNIKSAGNVNSLDWDIEFNSLKDPVVYGNVIINSGLTLTNKLQLTNLDVTFNEVNSYVTYQFSISNNGVHDAKLDSFIQESFKCNTGIETSEAKQDEVYVCNNLEYTLTYLANGNLVSKEDVFLAGSKTDVILKFAYKGGYLPINSVDITEGNITLGFVQG